MSAQSVFVMAMMSAAGAFFFISHIFLRWLITHYGSIWRRWSWIAKRWRARPRSCYFFNVRRIERLARQAGQLEKWTAGRVAWYKELSVLAAVLILLLLAMPRGTAVLWAIILVVFAWWWPELYLKQKSVRFQRELRRALPEVIDRLQLHISAGSTIEQALRRVGRSVAGTWGRELGKALSRLDLGQSFDEALQWLAGRVESAEFNRVIDAIRQAQKLGVSLAKTLAVQASLIRARRQQAALEQARTAAVKIALPLVLCIFPALLIVYLAPAVLRIVQGL